MADSSDYYDPAPTLSLERHVVVSGFHGAQPRLVARTVCALTGLGLIDLLRRVEHQEGRNFGALLLESGWRGVAEAEVEAMKRALKERPSIIAVQAHSMAEARVRAAIRKQTDFVVLGIDVSTSFWRVRHLQEDGLRLGPDVPVKVERIEELREAHGEYERAVRTAEHRLEVGFRPPLRVAQELQEWLLARATRGPSGG